MPLDLGKISDTPGPEEADSATELEEEDLDHQKNRALIEGMRQDIAERKKYAGRIFTLLSSWLLGIFAILLLQGFGSNIRFALPDSVLLAAIGGTTINVIGIFIVVARYLFPRRDTDKD